MRIIVVLVLTSLLLSCGDSREHQSYEKMTLYGVEGLSWYNSDYVFFLKSEYGIHVDVVEDAVDFMWNEGYQKEVHLHNAAVWDRSSKSVGYDVKAKVDQMFPNKSKNTGVSGSFSGDQK